MKKLTYIEKEIERNQYILKKLEKGDFECLSEEYKRNPEGAIAFHKRELQYFEECDSLEKIKESRDIEKKEVEDGR